MSVTLEDIRDQIKDDLDIVESSWKDDGELDKLINAAVRKAFRKILNIHEDYFLTSSTTSILATANELSYPSDIFANKIKSVHFVWDNNAIELKPVRRFDRTLLLSDIHTDSTPYRRYLPTDSLSGGKVLKLFPENGYAGDVTIWYIREPRTLVEDTDICDIDEFTDYIVQLVKTRYYRLDGDPRYQVEKAEERELEKDMIDTLTNMKEDNEDTIIEDMSHYEESV